MTTLPQTYDIPDDLRGLIETVIVSWPSGKAAPRLACVSCGADVAAPLDRVEIELVDVLQAAADHPASCPARLAAAGMTWSVEEGEGGPVHVGVVEPGRGFDRVLAQVEQTQPDDSMGGPVWRATVTNGGVVVDTIWNDGEAMSKADAEQILGRMSPDADVVSSEEAGDLLAQDHD